MLTQTVNTVFGSALSPLSVNLILFTVTGAISPAIVNVYTNGSVYTKECYTAVYLFITIYKCELSDSRYAKNVFFS